ncbi:MAG TPA: hypothetical protein VIA80_00670, partial [Hyphomonadaceae bacterium]
MSGSEGDLPNANSRHCAALHELVGFWPVASLSGGLTAQKTARDPPISDCVRKKLRGQIQSVSKKNRCGVWREFSPPFLP